MKLKTKEIIDPNKFDIDMESKWSNSMEFIIQKTKSINNQIIQFPENHSKLLTLYQKFLLT